LELGVMFVKKLVEKASIKKVRKSNCSSFPDLFLSLMNIRFALLLYTPVFFFLNVVGSESR
jgi:hypothetical protein